jgi:hypothetical protein
MLMPQELILICLLAVVSLSGAVPAVPTMFTEVQPNGMPITLQLQGDESRNWLSDNKGYPVLAVRPENVQMLSSVDFESSSGVTYVYAMPSAQSPSGLVATEAIVGLAAPESIPALVAAAPRMQDTVSLLKRRESKERMSCVF